MIVKQAKNAAEGFVWPLMILVMALVAKSVRLAI